MQKSFPHLTGLCMTRFAFSAGLAKNNGFDTKVKLDLQNITGVQSPPLIAEAVRFHKLADEPKYLHISSLFPTGQHISG